MNYIRDDPEVSRKQKRLKAAETTLLSLSNHPYSSQYLFLVIALDQDIKETFSVEFYNQIFKQAYRNTPDDDVDQLIRHKVDEVAEITSKEFKDENKANEVVMAIIDRIEKRLKVNPDLKSKVDQVQKSMAQLSTK